MATLTYSDLIAMAPELATDSDGQTRIGEYLDEAEDVIGDSVLATTAKRDKCRLLYAAHLVESYGACGGKGAGPVTGRTRGSRSVSYASPKDDPGDPSSWSSTKYGRRLLNLLRGGRHKRAVIG